VRSGNSKKTITAEKFSGADELKSFAKAELAKMAGLFQPNYATVNFA